MSYFEIYYHIIQAPNVAKELALSIAKNIFTIPPGSRFLSKLARFVLDANHLDGEDHDPLILSRTTIYLPTRRALRSLRNEFSKLLGTRPTFLPNLRTLGDGEHEDSDPFHIFDHQSEPKHVINPVARQIMLARLVKQWVEKIGEDTRRLFEDEDIIIPSSSAESLWLAKEIAELIDQMETEEISWESLKLLIPQKDEYAQWWQLTLEFLQIAMQAWPQILDELGACDPATYRRLILDRRTNKLIEQNAPGPVIAAGSTGSIPATARFLKTVSQMPQGTIILPGLDKTMHEEAWQEILHRAAITKNNNPIQIGTNIAGCEDHPQYGLAKLLETIGIAREDVVSLGRPVEKLRNRALLTSIAMLPSAQTGNWQDLVTEIPEDEIKAAISNIAIINAQSERQEALAIALVLRKQIETPNSHAALVTPDRNLARRVAAELKRFDLNIDDSAGSMLKNTDAAIFVRQLIAITTQPPNALTLTSLVKHPLLSIDEENSPEPKMGRLFEICLLRDALEVPAVGNFQQSVENLKSQLAQNKYCAQMIKNMRDEDWNNLISFCKRLDHNFTTLAQNINANKSMRLDNFFDDILQCAHNLTSKHGQTQTSAFSENDGELARFFEQVTNFASNEKAIKFFCRPDELLLVFDALVAGKIVRTHANTHPRISILGPLEARLQPLDCVILAALNEGTWPPRHDNGPFLNRPMKMTMELATPERRTGLSAHDFEQLLGCEKVFLTRSQRVENAPTVPSRWLQRLCAIFGADLTKMLKKNGEEFLNIADLLDEPETQAKRLKRPYPKPPIIHRPTSLSITEIETWIRDPYAIYARRILKLQPLGTIDTLKEPQLRGIILHDTVAEFVHKNINPFAADAIEKFINIVEDKLQSNKIPAHIKALWLPRFGEIARDFITFEQTRKPTIFQSYCEIDGKIEVADTGFSLRGRADRIDIFTNGEVGILDYKTGTKPSMATARTLAPQLALEGAMVIYGGFGEIGAKTPSLLEYVRLRPRGEFKQEHVNNDKFPTQQISLAKLAELERHILSYKNPDQGYLSRFAVEMSTNVSGDYDHLARVREWSWSSEGSNESANMGGEYD